MWHPQVLSFRGASSLEGSSQSRTRSMQKIVLTPPFCFECNVIGNHDWITDRKIMCTPKPWMCAHLHGWIQGRASSRVWISFSKIEREHSTIPSIPLSLANADILYFGRPPGSQRPYEGQRFLISATVVGNQLTILIPSPDVYEYATWDADFEKVDPHVVMTVDWMKSVPQHLCFFLSFGEHSTRL